MDAAQEFRTKVVEVVRRGSRTVSARFERPPGFSYQAGQWAFITIQRGTESLTKHLTLSSSPTEPWLEMTKGMTGHPFADAFAGLSIGDEVTIRGPSGTFTLDAQDEDVVFLSGGIGVTPLRSMARYITDTGILIRIQLLYSAHTEDDAIFLEEFEEMRRRNPRLHLAVTLTRPDPEWTGHTGRIDRAFIEREVPDVRGRGFYVSGPPAMVDAMTAILKEMAVPDDRVHREYFPGY